MHRTMIDACDLAAYEAWNSHRSGPAYLRGMPTWVWQSALGRQRRGPRPARTT